MSGQQHPRLPRVLRPHFHPELRVLLHCVRVLDGPRLLGGPGVVEVSLVAEHIWVPVQVDHVEEVLERLEIDPEHSIIHLVNRAL